MGSRSGNGGDGENKKGEVSCAFCLMALRAESSWGWEELVGAGAGTFALLTSKLESIRRVAKV